MWKTCQTFRGTTVIARLRHRVQPSLRRGLWLLLAVSVGLPVVLALTGSFSSGPPIRRELESTDERTLDQGESGSVTYAVGDIFDAIVKQGATPEEALTFLKCSLPTRRGLRTPGEV